MSPTNIFQPDGKNAIHDGIDHEPGGGKALLDLLFTIEPVCVIRDFSAGVCLVF